MNLLKVHAAVSTPLLLLVIVTAFSRPSAVTRFDEITVNRVNVVDSLGRTRVVLAGGYPPRRAALAGLLFINEDGQEAGGLVYRGTVDEDGRIQAGGILTFDQYRNDQIVALQYSQDGDQKSQGLTIQERPDTLSNLLKEAYGAIENAPDAASRDSLTRHYQALIPPGDIVARRLFAGRNRLGSAVVILSDPNGQPRLSLAVDSTGAARISFLDAEGRVVREITEQAGG